MPHRVGAKAARKRTPSQRKRAGHYKESMDAKRLNDVRRKF